MMKLLLAGAGGFIGSAARYLIGITLGRTASAAVLPTATLFVNVSGSFLIGLFAAHGLARGWLNDSMRVFVLVGVLGGFTTFSSFSYETLNLWREAGAARALLNVLLNVVLCLTAVWAGDAIGRIVTR